MRPIPYQKSRIVPLILPLEDGMAAYSEGTSTFLAVLSATQHKEAAARFIEHYISKLDPVERAAFDKTWTEAIENPDYERHVSDMEKRLSQREEQMRSAEGAERSALEESYQYEKKSLDSFRESGKYLATREDITAMHDLMSKLYVRDGLGNAQRQAVYSTDHLRQYTEGAITLDQFIQQMDSALRLVRMEYQ